MLTKLFLVFATAAKFALPAVNAQGSESHDQRRSPKTEAGFSPVPPPITGGDPTLGDVFGYYNYPRIQIGSPVENPEMDAGLSEVCAYFRFNRSFFFFFLLTLVCNQVSF